MSEANPQSSAELIRRAGEQMSTLIRTEIAIAQAELSGKARIAGTAAGLFGGAGVLAFYAVGVLIAAGVLGLAVVLPAWLAALLVGVALLLVTAVLVLVGRARARRVGSLVPERALHGLQADFVMLSHPGSNQLADRRLTDGRLVGDRRVDGAEVSGLGDTAAQLRTDAERSAAGRR